MKGRVASAIFSIVVCMAGCSSSIVSFTGQDMETHFVRTRGSRLSGGFSFVSLNAQRFEKRDEISYSLYIVYAGPTFINIAEGKSLTLIINGQRYELTGKGSEHHREVVSIGLVEEVAFYHDIVPDIIRRLSSAWQVVVEIRGSEDILRRHLGEKDINDFKMFYNHVAAMPPKGAALVMKDSLPYHPQMK